MQKQKKWLCLNDRSDGSTVLHVAAVKGYSDYAYFFIEEDKTKARLTEGIKVVKSLYIWPVKKDILEWLNCYWTIEPFSQDR